MGKKNGKGREYDRMGNLTFDGEYLNGKKLDSNGESFSNNKQLYSYIIRIFIISKI